MLAGNAPGRMMLCSSRLTPLLQDNKIRPIACGEMFYRLVMRFLLKARSVADDTLLDIQLGVGTPGGVEPIIEQIHREVGQYAERAAEDPQRFIYSLDFENAFNKVSRIAIAEAVSLHANHLFRLTEWAYGKQTPLVCRSGRTFVHLPSSQGVRQGDPLGPLLFSLVMRPKLELLKATITNQPTDVTMAYLDDVNITSQHGTYLDTIIALFNGNDGLTLNVNKTKCEPVATVASSPTGIHILGSVDGTIEARRTFLNNKIDAVERHIQRLRGLPHQQALLLLRQSIQPQLKHLLRTMELGDLVPELERLDKMVYDLMDYLRAKPDMVDPADPIIARIYSLPLTLGGCGLLSYVETRESARGAAREAADSHLRRMDIVHAAPIPVDAPVPPAVLVPAVAAAVLPPPVIQVGTQRERCRQVFDAASTAFVQTLPVEQRVAFFDNGSKCGTAWMHAIPQGKHRCLTDKQVAAALNIRVLQTDLRNRVQCNLCNQVQGVQHCEACPHSNFPATARHNYIRDLLADFVKSAGRAVAVEPPIINNINPARADLQVGEAEGVLQHGRLVDLSIKMVLAQDTQAVRNAVIDEHNGNPQDGGLKRVCVAQVNAALDKAVSDKNLHYAQMPPHPYVIPLVMSSGGTLHKALHLFLKDVQPDALLRRQFLIDVSLALIRARASTYVLE
jgi:hypothetical protein